MIAGGRLRRQALDDAQRGLAEVREVGPAFLEAQFAPA
jgi:hypothetical protein